MADNELLTDSVIAKEALMLVTMNLTLTKKISRRYEKNFAKEGKKIGDYIDIRKPVLWEGAREGEAMVPEGARERVVRLKVDRLIGQDLQFGMVDLTLKVDDFRERYLDTACASIANRIDKAVAEEFKNVPNFAGAPGTVPAALDPYFDASVILSNYGAPASRRSMVVSPRMEVTIVNALKGLFQAANAIAKQYESAMMGHVIGFDWSMDQNIKAHTVGPLGGTPLVDGAGQSGASILLKGYTTSAALRHNRGDCVTFAGVDGVEPMGRDDTAELRQFVVTADTNGTAGGAVTLPIFPEIILEGPYRNVTAAAADGAAVLTFGAVSSTQNKVTRQGLAFHKEWMQAAFVDLPLHKSMEMSARAHDPDTGVTIRIEKGYDMKSGQELCRLDVLFGLKQMYEDFCVRMCGS